RTLWNHPWLFRDHLFVMKEFSAEMRAAAMERIERIPRTEWSGDFGFVGNMANGMYIRAKALHRAGLAIDIIGASGDNFAMSQPGWEEFDGEISEDSLVR